MNSCDGARNATFRTQERAGRSGLLALIGSLGLAILIAACGSTAPARQPGASSPEGVAPPRQLPQATAAAGTALPGGPVSLGQTATAIAPSVTVTAAATASPLPAPIALSAQPPSVFVGVWQPGVPDDMSKLAEFEQEEHMHAAIVSWYESWDDAKLGPDISQFYAVSQHGSMPLVTWEPQDYRQWSNQPDFSLNQILSGRYDAYVTKWAQALAAYGKPVMLRWAHEMNGDWYPWGYRVNGNTPAQYVAAWRHMHDLFTAAGAKNVQWVWCPNVEQSSSDPFEAFYPGDQYVDWVGLDGTNRYLYGWRSFTQLFRDSYRRLTAMTQKPVLIGEMGSGEDPTDSTGSRKADWITSTLEKEIPSTFPQIRAFVWFNEDKGNGAEKDGEDWSLSTPAERLAFANAVARPPYTGSPPLNDLR